METQGTRFKKTKDPDPGSYNVEEAIKKAQWPTGEVHMIAKSKKQDFLGKSPLIISMLDTL